MKKNDQDKSLFITDIAQKKDLKVDIPDDEVKKEALSEGAEIPVSLRKKIKKTRDKTMDKAIKKELEKYLMNLKQKAKRFSVHLIMVFYFIQYIKISFNKITFLRKR